MNKKVRFGKNCPVRLTLVLAFLSLKVVPISAAEVNAELKEQQPQQAVTGRKQDTLNPQFERMIMILDQGEEKEDGAMTRELLANIVAKSAPMIVPLRIVDGFLGIGDSKLKAPGVDMTEWDISFIKGSPLMLFIPKNDAKRLLENSIEQDSLEPFFNENNLAKELSEKIKERMKSQGEKIDPTMIEAIFKSDKNTPRGHEADKLKTAQRDLYRSNLPRWNFYITGHGLTNHSIAGLEIKPFQKLLQFFNHVNTNLVAVSSCYAGGVNKNSITTPATEIGFEKDSLNYLVALSSVGESVTYTVSESVKTMNVAPKMNAKYAEYTDFFKALENPRNPNWLGDALFQLAINKKGILYAQNIPQILVPRVGVFYAFEPIRMRQVVEKELEELAVKKQKQWTTEDTECEKRLETLKKELEGPASKAAGTVQIITDVVLKKLMLEQTIIEKREKRLTELLVESKKALAVPETANKAKDDIISYEQQLAAIKAQQLAAIKAQRSIETGPEIIVDGRKTEAVLIYPKDIAVPVTFVSRIPKVISMQQGGVHVFKKITIMTSDPFSFMGAFDSLIKKTDYTNYLFKELFFGDRKVSNLFMQTSRLEPKTYLLDGNKLFSYAPAGAVKVEVGSSKNDLASLLTTKTDEIIKKGTLMGIVAQKDKPLLLGVRGQDLINLAINKKNPSFANELLREMKKGDIAVDDEFLLAGLINLVAKEGKNNKEAWEEAGRLAASLCIRSSNPEAQKLALGHITSAFFRQGVLFDESIACAEVVMQSQNSEVKRNALIMLERIKRTNNNPSEMNKILEVLQENRNAFLYDAKVKQEYTKLLGEVAISVKMNALKESIGNGVETLKKMAMYPFSLLTWSSATQDKKQEQDLQKKAELKTLFDEHGKDISPEHLSPKDLSEKEKEELRSRMPELAEAINALAAEEKSQTEKKDKQAIVTEQDKKSDTGTNQLVLSPGAGSFEDQIKRQHDDAEQKKKQQLQEEEKNQQEKRQAAMTGDDLFNRATKAKKTLLQRAQSFSGSRR